MSNKIEELGIAFIKVFLASRKNIICNIFFNDRMPCWDGNITLYTGGNIKNPNSDLIGRVPVQVKSSEIKGGWNRTETYYFKKDHLKNYSEEGGVLIIRPIIKEDNYRIYAKLLFTVHIESILNNSSNENLPIELNYIENDHQFERILLFFLENRKRQTYDMLSDQKVITSEKLVVTGLKTDSIPDFLFSPDTLFYSISKDGILIPTLMEINRVEQHKDVLIEVNGIIFFKKMTVIENKDSKKIIKLNSVITLDVEENKIKLNMKCTSSSTINDYFDAINFFIILKEHKSFTINGNRIDGLKYKSIDFKEKKYNYWTKIKKLLKQFKIDCAVITFKQLEDEANIIKKLIYLLYENKPALFNDVDGLEIKLKVEKLLNKNVLLFFQKISPGKYSGIDFMNIDIDATRVKKDDEMYDCSQYLIPTIHFNNRKIMDIIIGYEDKVLNDLKEKYQFPLFELYLKFFIAVLNTYDEKNYESLLELSENLINFISDSINGAELNSLCFVNKMQILKRKGLDFIESDLQKLIQIRDNDKSDLHMKCAVNILLENKIEFEILFKQLDDGIKDEFISWPIYHLYENGK